MENRRESSSLVEAIAITERNWVVEVDQKVDSGRTLPIFSDDDKVMEFTSTDRCHIPVQQTIRCIGQAHSCLFNVCHEAPGRQEKKAIRQ